jgi:hypothetical protein
MGQSQGQLWQGCPEKQQKPEGESGVRVREGIGPRIGPRFAFLSCLSLLAPKGPVGHGKMAPSPLPCPG